MDAFVAELLEAGAEPATARVRRLALRRFSAWLHEEGETDAAGITFCDVEGLRVLAQAETLARTRGRALLLVRPRPFLLYSLVLVGMQHLVDPATTGTVRARSARSAPDPVGSHPRPPGAARRRAR